MKKDDNVDVMGGVCRDMKQNLFCAVMRIHIGGKGERTIRHGDMKLIKKESENEKDKTENKKSACKGNIHQQTSKLTDEITNLMLELEELNN